MGKKSVPGSLTSPTEPSKLWVREATGVSCSSTQRIERRGRKLESGEDIRLTPLEKEGKQKRTDLVLDEFAANNFCMTE